MLDTSPTQDKRQPDGSGASSLYIDLMKRCLLDAIYADDPLALYVPYRRKSTTAAWKRRGIALLERILAQYRIKLVEPYSVPWLRDMTALTPEELERGRENGLYWPVRAHTMIGRKRLDNLQYCLETCIAEGVPGDFIETGVWRGGASIFARAVLKAHAQTERRVWLADSFAGLPPPDAANYAADADDVHHTYADWLAVSRAQVQRNFERYGLLDDQVRFLEGWFKDTLPGAPIERLAVLRLDGDMYESTIQALEALYDRLSPGGFVIVDDYFLEPCAKAVHDFRRARNLAEPISDIDGMGAYWRRSIS